MNFTNIFQYTFEQGTIFRVIVPIFTGFWLQDILLLLLFLLLIFFHLTVFIIPSIGIDTTSLEISFDFFYHWDTLGYHWDALFQITIICNEKIHVLPYYLISSRFLFQWYISFVKKVSYCWCARYFTVSYKHNIIFSIFKYHRFISFIVWSYFYVI